MLQNHSSNFISCRYRVLSSFFRFASRMVSIFHIIQAITCKDGSVYIYKPTDAFQIRDWHVDSSFQINKQSNCLSWCKSRDHPMSIVIGTEDDAQIWEISNSHTWEQRAIFSERNGIIRNVAWSNSLGKSYETIATACSVVYFYI